MKKYIYPLFLLMALPMLFASCLSDEDETVTDDYCYISAFTLGSLKQTHHTLSSENLDSTYTSTFSGSLFPMTIDHRNLTIENLDSLPIRTKVDKVLATVTFEGTLAWRKANITNAEDTVWTTYSSSDSLDFSEPLHFACMASNGNSYRQYTVKVNVHQQMGDSTTWNALGEASALSNMGERKALIKNGLLIVLGENSNGGTLLYAQHANGLTGDWTTLSTTGTEGAQVNSLQRMGSTLYMNNANGQVLTSTNAVDWMVSDYPSQTGLQLVAASDSKLYALIDGSLKSSNGGEWVDETLDDETSNLPASNVNAVYYTAANGNKNLMLVGDNGTDSRAVVWEKSWQVGQEDAEGWMYYTPNQTDKYRCPLAKSLNVVSYDNGMLAFGGDSKDGEYTAMSEVLYSQDHGITWKEYEDDDMEVDEAITTAAEDADYITSAVDDESHLWVIVGNKVWRGRINRLGFLRQDAD